MSGAGTEMRQPPGEERSGSRRGGRPARTARRAASAGAALGALALPLGLSAAEAPPAGAATHHAASAVHHAASATAPPAITASGSFHRRGGGIGVKPWLWVGGSLAVTGGLLVVVDTRRRRLH